MQDEAQVVGKVSNFRRGKTLLWSLSIKRMERVWSNLIKFEKRNDPFLPLA